MTPYFVTDYARFKLAISYWETRKVRGWLAPFFVFHNLKCDMRADVYRAKLKGIKK